MTVTFPKEVAARHVASLQLELGRANERNQVLSKQLAAAEHELRAYSSEHLKLYRRFHKQAPARSCASCNHRHLSKAHGRVCPDCPCAERPS